MLDSQERTEMLKRESAQILDFIEALESKLLSSPLKVEDVICRFNLRGKIIFPDNSFYYDYAPLYKEYKENKEALDKFIQNFTHWRAAEKLIRNIYSQLLKDNDLDLPVIIRHSYGYPMAYNSGDKSLESCPKKFLKLAPKYIGDKEELLPHYLTAVALHEIGHYMEDIHTNLGAKKQSLLEDVKSGKITKEAFCPQYAKLKLQCEYLAWEWASKLKCSLPIDETQFTRTRAVALSSYEENIEESTSKYYDFFVECVKKQKEKKKNRPLITR